MVLLLMKRNTFSHQISFRVIQNCLLQKDRTARKQQQIEENQFFEDSEGLLYGPGIADSSVSN